MLDDNHEAPDRGLPFGEVGFLFRKGGDVLAGVKKGDERSSVWSRVIWCPYRKECAPPGGIGKPLLIAVDAGIGANVALHQAVTTRKSANKRPPGGGHAFRQNRLGDASIANMNASILPANPSQNRSRVHLQAGSST